MNQEAITYIENNFKSFKEVKFLKELNIQSIKVAKDIFKKAIDTIADRNMKQRKNVELTKWARDARKCKHNYFNSIETKLYMYKVTRKSILASQKLLCTQEEKELYEELLEVGAEKERGDEEGEHNEESEDEVGEEIEEGEEKLDNYVVDKKKFRSNFLAMKRESKWYLSTGKCVEDELFAFGMQCHHDHPSHSFIIDTRDSNYKTYKVFSPAELDEIKAFEEKKLPTMPTELRDYINSFNKNSIQELRSQIFQSQEFDQEYSHKDSHDYDWVRFTVYALLREYESGSLKEEHSEAWYMAHVWHFIDTVFNGEDEITVVRGETSSSSSSKRKNKNRSIAAVEPLERKKMGKKCDMIFAKKSCGHDEEEEYGASEAGKAYDGDQATKRLEEGFVKLPKCLKDMLDNILSKCNDNKKLQTIGFIHSGLQSYVIRADRPTKYITRIQTSRNYHLSSDISRFGTTVLPAIYIAWVIKDIVRNTYNIIQESNTHNNNSESNIQGSEWLTQYWEESEKEDGPETSSSQEKVLKKSKSFY